MKILVTGSAGFIGSWLVPELRSHGHEVIGVDTAYGPGNDLRWPEIADLHIGKHRPDVVVHLAAQAGRIFSEDDLGRAVELNATMTAHAARACAAHGARLVYTSTSEIYGDQDGAICWEGGPEVLPPGIYGLSKRFGEDLARLYAPSGLQIVRPSMTYGPGLPAGRGRAALMTFLWHASRQERLTVHRGARRSWCWIGDVVRGFRLVIEQGERATTAGGSEGGVGVYNIGRDDEEVSMRTLAEMACDLAGAPHTRIDETDSPGLLSLVKRLSMAKLRGLGWIPEVDLEDGMRRTWEVVRRYDEQGMPQEAVAA